MGAGTEQAAGTVAWRCWALHSLPGVLCSYLDPNRFNVVWPAGQPWLPAWCAFHRHPAPDDCPVCGRCGWRGQPDLAELVWWLADWKQARPNVIGRVELVGKILQGDHAHREIPGIRRAELIRVTGPLVVAPGYESHIGPLAGRYGAEVIPSSAAAFDRHWVKAVRADLGLDLAEYAGRGPEDQMVRGMALRALGL